MFFDQLRTLMSSIHIQNLRDWDELLRSFMKFKNRRETNTPLWVTPLSKGITDEQLSPMLVKFNSAC